MTLDQIQLVTFSASGEYDTFCTSGYSALDRELQISVRYCVMHSIWEVVIESVLCFRDFTATRIHQMTHMTNIDQSYVDPARRMAALVEVRWRHGDEVRRLGTVRGSSGRISQTVVSSRKGGKTSVSTSTSTFALCPISDGGHALDYPPFVGDDSLSRPQSHLHSHVPYVWIYFVAGATWRTSRRRRPACHDRIETPKSNFDTSTARAAMCSSSYLFSVCHSTESAASGACSRKRRRRSQEWILLVFCRHHDCIWAEF